MKKLITMLALAIVATACDPKVEILTPEEFEQLNRENWTEEDWERYLESIYGEKVDVEVCIE